MSEVSIGALRIPQTRRARIGEKLAREVVFKLLGKLQVGSLALHEGPLRHHFGQEGKAQEPPPPSPPPAPDPQQQLSAKLEALDTALGMGALSPALYEQARRELA